MCGIAGFLHFSDRERFTVSQLLTCSQIISHRGPDDEGFAILGKENQIFPAFSSSWTKPLFYPEAQPVEEWFGKNCKAALLHRRLSIIDPLPEAHQPFSDKQRRVWLNFNGEIYNYQSLRTELRGYGYVFHTQSDTEVLFYAWQQWGKDCLHHLDGMWALTILDLDRKCFFAACDPAGIKPIYYWKSKEGLCFASEIKAFSAFGIPFLENQKAVSRFLLYGKSDESEETFFQDIFRLPGGQFLEISLDNFDSELGQYHHWKPAQGFDFQPHVFERQRVSQIQELLMEMIRLRQQADVPLGLCLSGGIDSSTVGGLLATSDRFSGKTETRKAFMARLSHGSVNDEFAFASMAAKRFGFELITIQPDAQNFLAQVEDMIFTQDEPAPGPNAFSQYAIFQAVKQHGITVSLDGQGADEIFGGYPLHLSAHSWESMAVGGQWTGLNSPWLASVSWFIRQQLNPAREQQFLTWKKPWFSIISEEAWKLAGRKENQIQGLNNLLRHEFTSTSLPYLLKSADRNSMRWSVESRMPFADYVPLISYLHSIPGSAKVRDGCSKYLLREAAKPFVNQEILNRKDKIGFAAPNKEWITAIPKTWWQELLREKNSLIETEKLQANLHNLPHQDLIFTWRMFAYLVWNRRFIQDRRLS